MHIVAKTPEYIRRAEKLLADDERRDVLNYLATHPKSGDLMEGTGGVRKLRWSRGSLEKAAACEQFIIFTMKPCRSTC
jgi:hypothetical protein